MRRRRHNGRTGLRSELPYGAAAGSSRITLFGKKSALVEGHCGVIEMNAPCIRFKGADGIMSIRGKDLAIRELSQDAAMITGEDIKAVAYDDELR